MPSIDNVNADRENVHLGHANQQLFDRGYCTEDTWKLSDRTPNCEPTEHLRYDGHQIPVWKIEETRPAKIRAHTKARIEIRRRWNPCVDKHIVELTPGLWTTVTSNPEARFAENRHFFTKKLFFRHLDGRASYGCYSLTSQMGVLDLDFSNDDRQVYSVDARSTFLELFKVIATELPQILSEWRARAIHYQIAEQDAAGIHILWMYPKKHDTDKMERLIKERLSQLDAKYPQLLRQIAETGASRIKSFGQIEVYPNSHNGFRIAPAPLRDIVTNELIEKNNEKHNLVVYNDWLKAYNREQAAVGDVLELLEQRLFRPEVVLKKGSIKLLPYSSPNSNDNSHLQPTRSSKTKGHTWTNNTARTITQFFWGTNNPALLFNEVLGVLARFSPHFCTDVGDACDKVNYLIRNIPREAWHCSSRLKAQQFSRIVKNFRGKASKAWDGKLYQGNPEQSEAKIAASVSRWKRIGFNPFDCTTWTTCQPYWDLAIDWTTDDQIDIHQVFAPLLKRQIDTTQLATRIVQLVIEKEREETAIAKGYWKKFFEDQGIKCGDNWTQSKLVKASKELGLIEISHERFHIDTQVGLENFYSKKPGSNGLATRYQPGPRANNYLGRKDIEKVLEKLFRFET